MRHCTGGQQIIPYHISKPHCCRRYGVLRGMPSLLFYMGRNLLAGALGWGPSYAVTAVKHDAKLGLEQVRLIVLQV